MVRQVSRGEGPSPAEPPKGRPELTEEHAMQSTKGVIKDFELAIFAGGQHNVSAGGIGQDLSGLASTHMYRG